ncbi:uncharacterized protein LOC130656197 [Hydractinia symbiolongicarpus]|uniref:uncharacterized protein LOC130656197 n=1 Tax=Hydractinia symbiolongicarpus TaxID=13093 RepID=UPI00254F91DA|nr:uncharacterized protein LOC130656197 [Hydractinia symbiolongicarpus]
MEDKQNCKSNLYPFLRTMTAPSSSYNKDFLVQNFNNSSSSDYQRRFNRTQLHGKRKCASESLFHPVTKQQITEARIASSMQRLSLLNDDNSAAVPNTNRNSDEGFFEDSEKYDFNIESDEEDLSSESNSPSELPGFRLAPGVLKHLKENTRDILPKHVFDSVNTNYLAVIPYTPPTDIRINFHKKKDATNEKQESEIASATVGVSPKVISENDNEMFAAWEEIEDVDMIS